MRCTNHKREFDGACNWCGKKLCEMCVAQQQGRKIYCEHCAVALVPYKAERRPAFTVTQKPAQVAQVATAQTGDVKRRFILGKDGYFELK